MPSILNTMIITRYFKIYFKTQCAMYLHFKFCKYKTLSKYLLAWHNVFCTWPTTSRGDCNAGHPLTVSQNCTGFPLILWHPPIKGLLKLLSKIKLFTRLETCYGCGVHTKSPANASSGHKCRFVPVSQFDLSETLDATGGKGFRGTPIVKHCN